MSKEKKVFFLYTITIVVLVTTGFTFLYYFKSQVSYFLTVRIYNIIEYSLLAYFFSLYIKNNGIRKLIFLSIIFYFLFCLFSFLNQKKQEMPFVPATVEHILLLIIIIYFFFEIVQHVTLEPVYQRAIFWISVAFIINSSGNFFLFLYSKSSYNDPSFKTQYTIIYGVVTVLKNIFLCISIPIKEHSQKSTLNESLNIDLDPFKPIETKP